MTPTERTKAKLLEMGFMPAVVEKFNPHVGPYGIRQDLFGFIDVLGVGVGGTMAIQSTSDGVAARVRKILDDEHRVALLNVLAAGWCVEVWGFAKRRSRKRNADGARSKKIEIRLRRVRILGNGGQPMAVPVADPSEFLVPA